MISFDDFKDNGIQPIYQQICHYFKCGIIAQSIVDGDELPSRRYLSALLGINPNTVQKAFKQLEDEQLIESRAGAKSYARVDEKKMELIREELLMENIQSVISTLKKMGISKKEVLRLLEKVWDGDEYE